MTNNKVYDTIIIGAGPAGITAAVYASRKGMSLVVLTGDVGGQTVWSGKVENYTGYQFISGAELANKFHEHMKQYDIPVNLNEEAVDIRKQGDLVAVKTEKAVYSGRTAIIASGKRSRELNVAGEKEYRNKGVTYCATCDGPLFRGRDVAVVGGGNSALDATLQLMKIAGKVYLINIASGITGDEIMKDKVSRAENVAILNDTSVTAISGDGFVKSITVKSPEGEREITVEGVFVEIGLLPNSAPAKGIDKNGQGEIRVDSRNRTSVPGIFAAGDVTDVPEKQIIVAAGEGAKAALGVFSYLSRSRDKEDWYIA